MTMTKNEADFLIRACKTYIDDRFNSYIQEGGTMAHFFEEMYMKNYNGGMPLDQQTFRTYLRVVKYGNGILRIEKTSTRGLVDTYTIYYTDDSTSTFNIINGKDGGWKDIIDDTTITTEKTWSSSKIDATKENKENKVTEISDNSTDTEYPSAKAVYNKIKDIKFNVGEIEPTTTNFIEGETYEVQSAFQRVANLFSGFWNKIQVILGLIPSQASTTNQLADKAFVNATIATQTANFRGSWAKWSDVPADANLYPSDYEGNKKPTNNDYLVVQDASEYGELFRICTKGVYDHIYIIGGDGEEIDVNLSNYGTEEHFHYNNLVGIQRDYSWASAHVVIKVYADGYYVSNTSTKPTTFVSGTDISPWRNTEIAHFLSYLEITPRGAFDGQWRFLYTGDWDTDGKNGWHPSYRIGTAFTQAQQAALNSNITAEKVTKYDNYEQRITDLQTNKVTIVNTANKIYGTDDGGEQTAYDKSDFATKQDMSKVLQIVYSAI